MCDGIRYKERGRGKSGTFPILGEWKSLFGEEAKRSCSCFTAGSDVELRQNGRDMMADCFGRDEETAGNFGVLQVFSQETKDFHRPEDPTGIPSVEGR